MDPIEHKQLSEIEERLEEIRDQSASRWIALRTGLWQGIGWILGSIIALLILGWVLSLFGIIPGLDRIANNLRIIVERVR